MFGRVLRDLLDRGDVVQRHPQEAFDQRAETGLHLGLPVADSVAIERPWNAFS